MATKKDKYPSKKKDKYRIRNWGKYNKSLKNRGSINFCFSPEAVEKWYSKEPSDGMDRNPKLYSDMLSYVL